MERYKPLRTALCVYEGMRLIFLVWAYMTVQPEGEILFPWLTLITPGALFFLMALFWLINMKRHRVYSPLYLAGKGIGIITTMFWLFFPKNDTIRKLLIDSMTMYVAGGIIIFLLVGDLISVWLVVKVFNIGEQ